MDNLAQFIQAAAGAGFIAKMVVDGIRMAVDEMSVYDDPVFELRERLTVAHNKIDARDSENTLLRTALREASIEAHVGSHFPKPWDSCDFASCVERKRLLQQPFKTD